MDVDGNLEYRSTIKLWSLDTGESRLIAQLLGVPTHFSFSPDGSRLAATSNLGIIGSMAKNPGDGIFPDRIQTGGSIHVWRVSDGRELLKVDIELPDYTAMVMQLRRTAADDPEFNREAAGKALVAAYAELVRKRVPYRLNFSPDGQRLIGVSKSGEETIFDSQTGKPLRPTARGEKDGADHPATAPESKSEGKDAFMNSPRVRHAELERKVWCLGNNNHIVVCVANATDSLMQPVDLRCCINEPELGPTPLYAPRCQHRDTQVKFIAIGNLHAVYSNATPEP